MSVILTFVFVHDFLQLQGPLSLSEPVPLLLYLLLLAQLVHEVPVVDLCSIHASQLQLMSARLRTDYLVVISLSQHYLLRGSSLVATSRTQYVLVIIGGRGARVVRQIMGGSRRHDRVAVEVVASLGTRGRLMFHDVLHLVVVSL